jgi:hypothetical protein
MLQNRVKANKMPKKSQKQRIKKDRRNIFPSVFFVSYFPPPQLAGMVVETFALPGSVKRVSCVTMFSGNSVFVKSFA